MSDKRSPLELLWAKIIDVIDSIGRDIYQVRFDLRGELGDAIIPIKAELMIKTAFTGPIMLSSNVNKVICTVPKTWKLLYIDWRDGSNTGWSTYTNVVVNRGGFFQWRFQNCPFALQINGNGELKCYSIDSGKEAFIKTVLWQ